MTNINIHRDSLAIKEGIKQLLKANGYSQQDLASYLGLSLPMVRKILNSDNLTIERLMLICDFFDLSFFDFIEIVRSNQKTVNYLSDEQFEYLNESDKVHAIFISLISCNSIDEVHELLQVNKNNIKKIMLKMENLKIIRLFTDGSFKFLIKPPVQIKNKHKEKSRDKISRWHVSVNNFVLNNNKLYNGTNKTNSDRLEIYCHENTIREYRKELKSLFSKISLRSKYDQASFSKKELKYYSVSHNSGDFSGWIEMFLQSSRELQ